MKSNRFILDSDFATLKNDTKSNVITASIVSGTIFNIGTNNVLATALLTVGTINANIRARGTSSKHPKQMIGVTLYSDFLYSIPSIPGAGIQTGTLYCNLERINATTMRLTLATEAGAGAPDFKVEENQTITFVFSTFLSPFN